MEAGAPRKPWYRRQLSRRHEIITTALSIPGFILALFAEPIAVRLVGLALIWAAAGLWVYGLRRSEDA